MVDLVCPNCGGVGSVPNEKAHSRMVCRKCHMVFHMTATGRTVLGEPPPQAAGKDHGHGPGHGPAPAHPMAVKDLAQWDFTLTRAQAFTILGLAALFVIGFAYFSLTGGAPEALSYRAQRAANALGADDLETLKGFATPDTAGDVATWYQSVHPQVAEMKKESASKELLVTVVPLSENYTERSGQAEFLYAAARGASRTEKILNEAGTNPHAKSLITLTTFWILDSGGVWRLDGRQTQMGVAATRR